MAKEWAWSFSKLNNFETCGLKHYHQDIAKTEEFKEEPSEQMAWGNRVHLALAESCKKGVILPAPMADYKPWVDRVRGWSGETFIEQKYAITREFQPTEYFANNCWYRGIGDVVNIDGIAGLILDWKTGKIKEDSVQLALMAQCIFSHFPAVKIVRSLYVWLQEDDCKTEEIFRRGDMADLWGGLMPRVRAYENAVKTSTFLPNPSGLCKRHCPVYTCKHHGKGLR